jgi:hypothetical protein
MRTGIGRREGRGTGSEVQEQGMARIRTVIGKGRVLDREETECSKKQ